MLNRRNVFGSALVLVGAALALVATSVAARDDKAMKQNLQPVVTWSGDHSAIGESKFDRITNDQDWRTFWAAHSGERVMRNHLDELEVPQIDFDRMMAVVIVAEEQAQCRSVHIEGVAHHNGTVRVRFAQPHYAIDMGMNEAEPELPKTRPFAVAVVPMSDRPIVFEMGQFDKSTNTYRSWQRVGRVE